MLFVVLLSVHFGLAAWARVAPRRAIRDMAIGFYLGFVLAGTLLCYDILTNQTIFFRLVHVWPYDQKYLSADDLPPYYLNHRMAALAILFWPAFLTWLHLPATGWRRWVLLAGFAPALTAVTASEHATSQLALVLSACVALLGLWSLTTARRLLMLAWGFACVAVVPLCLAAYAANMHQYSWLAASARHRVVIWKATSDQVPKAPILGVGIHSARPLSRSPGDYQIAPGTTYPLAVALHSHNAFLQVWFEAGAVGAAILLSFGLITLRSIASLERSAQPALFASFASCAMISATGFSAFAPWQTASFAMCALFAALALAQLRSNVMLPRT
jgi:O-antigen ligase